MFVILLLPLLALLAWVCYEAVKPTLATTPAAKVVGDPLEILKLRYAKGEIDKKAYDRIKKDLS